MSASLRRRLARLVRLARLARLARLERRRGMRPMRFVLVRPGEPEPEAREGELLFVMQAPLCRDGQGVQPLGHALSI